MSRRLKPKLVDWLVAGLVLIGGVGVMVLLLIALGSLWNPVAAHDWYAGQSTPGGLSCCGGHDCRPLKPDEIRLNDHGEIEVLLRDEWWPALDPQWFIGSSPDGSFHACIAPADWQPRCVFGGFGT